MKKCYLKLLERIFDAEINAAIKGTPFNFIQTKSKLIFELRDMGMVEEAVVVLKGFPPCELKGWALTDLGRYEYCKSTKKINPKKARA